MKTCVPRAVQLKCIRVRVFKEKMLLAAILSSWEQVFSAIMSVSTAAMLKVISLMKIA